MKSKSNPKGNKDTIDGSSKLGSQRKVWISVSFDGGARGNPGVAGAGAEVIARYKPYENDSIMMRQKFHVRYYVGNRSTNNEAEYQGAIVGLQQAMAILRGLVARNGNTAWQVDIAVQGDSNLIIKQFRGEYDCKSDNLKPLLQQARAIILNMKKIATSVKVQFEHVYRSDNTVADGMSKERQFWYDL
jgi:ribonuclease HI